MKIKSMIWSIIYMMVAAVIFIICYVEKQRSLLESLLGLCFVLLIGFSVMTVQEWIEREKVGLLKGFAAILLLVNVTFFIVEFVLFSESLASFLISAIPFTVVYGSITWMRLKRGT